jgi:TP53 regulating kinase-like protein
MSILIFNKYFSAEWSNDILERIAKNVGSAIASMHDAEVVHGDLTTSNILIKLEETPSPFDVVLIDFGLGAMKPSIEDKAVDLYVLERAFVSSHPGSEKLVERLLEHYRFMSKKGTTILLKLDQVG